MSFITWIIALPATLLLFFFPAVPVPAPADSLSTAPSQIELIEVKTDATVAKDTIVKTLQDANIQVNEIAIPSSQPPFIAVGGDIETPSMPEDIQPEVNPAPEAPVVTSIEVTDVSPRTLYSGCSASPTALLIVHVRDQNGNVMAGESVAYEGGADNNPSGEFKSEDSEGRFSYAIKGIEKGVVKLTFKTGSVSASVDLSVTPAPTDFNRPSWCD